MIVEYKENEMIVVPMEENYQVCTNFMISVLSLEEKISCERYTLLQEELSQKVGMLQDEQESMMLLSKVSRADTMWSCVYNNTNLTLDICINRDYSNI